MFLRHLWPDHFTEVYEFTHADLICVLGSMINAIWPTLMIQLDIRKPGVSDHPFASPSSSAAFQLVGNSQ